MFQLGNLEANEDWILLCVFNLSGSILLETQSAGLSYVLTCCDFIYPVDLLAKLGQSSVILVWITAPYAVSEASQKAWNSADNPSSDFNYSNYLKDPWKPIYSMDLSNSSVQKFFLKNYFL